MSEKDTSGPVSLQTATMSALAKINELKSGARKNTGFLSNFNDLDSIVGGFQPGSLNIETYSEANLPKTGVYRYAEDPSFELRLSGLRTGKSI